MKQRKNLKIVLIIIGIILIFLAIINIYISYKIDKTYEVKDYKTIETVRTEEKETYKGISIENIVVLLVGLICIASPFASNITNAINNEKISEIKYKLLRMSKRNILRTLTITFWIYMAVSLTFTLREVFLDPDWNQVVMQNSQSEIIKKYAIFVIARCSFKRYAMYFNIFRS